MRRLPGPLLLVSLLGCGDPEPRRAPPTPDKQSLYGDPGLVPTREGERARRELALAGQLRAALVLLPGVRDAAVDVTLERDNAPGRTTVTLRGTADEDELRTLVRGVVGPIPDAELRIISIADEGAPAPVRMDLPLALALLGLGVSLGITVERGRRRRHR